MINLYFLERSQYLDLERKLQLSFENLEYCSTLLVQLINYCKTEAMWPVRAIGPPKSEIPFGSYKLLRVKGLKYLGYWTAPQLGFSTLIERTMLRVRQKVGLINSVQISDSSSPYLRKALFR